MRYPLSSGRFRSRAIPSARSPFRLIARFLGRWHLVWIILLAALCLSGCVRYDTEIQFRDPHQGLLIQRMQLADPLATLNPTTTAPWIDALEQQVRQWQGKVQRSVNQELTITIPFFNAADLEKKFNDFSEQVVQANLSPPSAPSNRSTLGSHLTVQSTNYLLVQRTRIIYDLDLRSLGFSFKGEPPLLNSSTLLKLSFSLKTPLGASWEPSPEPGETQQGSSKDFVWKLPVGQQHHLEAVFWLPDPIGIGAVCILLLISGAGYLRYRVLPDSTWKHG